MNAPFSLYNHLQLRSPGECTGASAAWPRGEPPRSYAAAGSHDLLIPVEASGSALAILTWKYSSGRLCDEGWCCPHSGDGWHETEGAVSAAGQDISPPNWWRSDSCKPRWRDNSILQIRHSTLITLKQYCSKITSEKNVRIVTAETKYNIILG